MALGIRNRIDFAAGVMYLAIAAAFAFGARDLRLGTADSMGPGYFPIAVSSLLAVVGLIVLAQALSPGALSTRLERWHVSKLLVILGSVIVFALLLEPAGLVVSVFALVGISSLASNEFDWRVAAINAIFLAALGAVIFVYGLKLLLPLWPQFLRG
jgi:hypothetical protein